MSGILSIGDIHPIGTQLGLTVVDTLSASITLWNAYTSKPVNFIFTLGGSDRTVTLPNITSDNSDQTKAKVGHNILIANNDTMNDLYVDDGVSSPFIVLYPYESANFTASSTTWEYIKNYRQHASEHIQGGGDEIVGDDVNMNTLGVDNYTPIDTTIGGHLEGIDNALVKVERIYLDNNVGIISNIIPTTILDASLCSPTICSAFIDNPITDGFTKLIATSNGTTTVSSSASPSAYFYDGSTAYSSFTLAENVGVRLMWDDAFGQWIIIAGGSNFDSNKITLTP